MAKAKELNLRTKPRKKASGLTPAPPRLATSALFATRGGSLGLAGGSATEVIARLEEGFPFKFLDNFRRSTDLPMETIAEAVRIPPRTLSRRRAEGRLRPDESERLLRVSTVFEKAVALFDGDRDGALQWLRSPQRGLGGQTPLDFARTEVGAAEVHDLIGRLEHGVYT